MRTHRNSGQYNTQLSMPSSFFSKASTGTPEYRKDTPLFYTTINSILKSLVCCTSVTAEYISCQLLKIPILDLPLCSDTPFFLVVSHFRTLKSKKHSRCAASFRKGQAHGILKCHVGSTTSHSGS